MSILQQDLDRQALRFLEGLQARKLAQERADGFIRNLPSPEFQERYRTDPAGFVENCIEFPTGSHPAVYQLDSLQRLAHNHRLAVRGPHGLGKTAMAAWAVWWFALTNDGNDWKIPCTASVWRQLTKFLFPEIRLWSRRIKWDVIGREQVNYRSEMMSLTLKLATGEAFAITGSDAETIEGAHADNLFYIFDESKIIPEPTWNSAEGAFASGNTYWLAISTPGSPSGRFYDIHSSKEGFDDWDKMHVTLSMATDAGRIKLAWAAQREKQWGKNSAIYKNRVLGEFASSLEDNVISLELVEASQRRWQDWMRDYKLTDEGVKFEGVAVDVGRGGDDSVLAPKFVDKDGIIIIGKLEKHNTKDVMKIVGFAKAMFDRLIYPVFYTGFLIVHYQTAQTSPF